MEDLKFLFCSFQLRVFICEGFLCSLIAWTETTSVITTGTGMQSLPSGTSSSSLHPAVSVPLPPLLLSIWKHYFFKKYFY